MDPHPELPHINNSRVDQSRMLLFPVAFLLCFLAAATIGGDAPIPTPWPLQFHANLVMEMPPEHNLSLAILWYDWPRGHNLHIICYQHPANAPYYEAEWNNGTSFFTPVHRTCRAVAIRVGILCPDWLVPGSVYLGRREANGFECNIWAKADFITYYEDICTKELFVILGLMKTWLLRNRTPAAHFSRMALSLVSGYSFVTEPLLARFNRLCASISALCCC
jgi:hypothetical protein